MGKLISKNSKGEIIELGGYRFYNYFINCSNMNLIDVFSIPNELNALYSHNNQLTSLPELPKNLTHLACEDNNIKQLPNLRELEKLEKVWCDICCFESYMLEMKNVDFTFFC